MIHSRWIAALASICAIAVTLPVFAAQTWMAQVVDQPSRFSGPGVYVGKPALPVTLSMIIAGGGPSNFKTLTLVKALAGAKTDAEVASLTKKFGSAKVTHFVTIFPFVISDSLKIVKAKSVALPSVPNPDPKNGKALAGALWAAGQTGHGFDVEVMLDRAVSHPRASDGRHRCQVRPRSRRRLPRGARASDDGPGLGLSLQRHGPSEGLDVKARGGGAIASPPTSHIRGSWSVDGGGAS
jgi:hypothetical protein